MSAQKHTRPVVSCLLALLIGATVCGRSFAQNKDGDRAPRERPERARRDRDRPRDRGKPGEGGEMQERLHRIAMMGGPVEPGDEAWLEQYLTTHLLRAPDLDAVTSAHYSVAEIYMRRGDHRKAVTRLEQALKSLGNAESESVWLTHLNLANIARNNLGDMAQGAQAYKKVKGRWAAYAQRRLLDVLAGAGKLDEAVAVLEAQVKGAADQGEKLALLRQMAQLYARHKEDEKAIAAYDRIAKEFQPADIAAMQKAARTYVEEKAKLILEFMQARRFEDVERTRMEVQQYEMKLRMQGRTDELRTFHEAMRRAHRKMEARERERRPERDED